MGNKDQDCPASAVFVQQDVGTFHDKVSLEKSTYAAEMKIHKSCMVLTQLLAESFGLSMMPFT